MPYASMRSTQATRNDSAGPTERLQAVKLPARLQILRPADRGFVCLIDDRFHLASVRASLPQWWEVKH